MLLREILSQILTLVNIPTPRVTETNDFVADIITNSRFLVKTHQLWTADGYRLTMHQIPAATMSANSVLLLHGLLSCAGQWVVNGNKSLAFQLSRAGYDVWIINHRGYYDVPAAIDYILRTRKKKQLHVIAHSQGATALLTSVILRPAYNKKIISSYIFNPAIFLHHLYKIPSDIVHNLVELEFERKMNAAPLRNSLFIHVIQQFCQQPLVGVVCTGFLSELFGGNSRQSDEPQKLVSIYAKYVLDNASVKQMSHLVQLIDAQNFQMYDYGSKINHKYYNMSQPPTYDLSGVLFPVTVMYGSIDGLTSAADVKLLIGQLRNVEDVIVLPWNHLDVIHSKYADKWLNNRIINSMNKYK